MAISGLVALKNILDLLYENGKHMIDIAGSLTMWFVSLFLSALSLNCIRHFPSARLINDCATNCDTGQS